MILISIWYGSSSFPGFLHTSLVFLIFSLCVKWNALFIRTSSHLVSSKGGSPPLPPFKVAPSSKWSNNRGRGGGWGDGISWDIEKISCWNSRGQLKKKVQFSRKGLTQFYRILRVNLYLSRTSKGKEIFVLAIFSKSKVTNLKDPGFIFKKVCPQSHCEFFWNSSAIITYVLVSLVTVRILTKRWKIKC